MPLISLNAAQRSTFHTHISNSDPSSCARHIPSSAAEGMQGEAAGQGPIYMELIFCFMGRFVELRRSGLERAGGMCQVYDQAAACMHDLRYTYMGRPFFTRSHRKREKVQRAPTQRSLSQMLPTDAERRSGTFDKVDQRCSARGHQ